MDIAFRVSSSCLCAVCKQSAARSLAETLAEMTCEFQVVAVMFASLRDVRHKKDVAEGQGGGTHSDSIPAAQDARSVGSTIRLQDEPCRAAEAAGSPTASDTLPIHSEVQLKPKRSNDTSSI